MKKWLEDASLTPVFFFLIIDSMLSAKSEKQSIARFAGRHFTLSHSRFPSPMGNQREDCKWNGESYHHATAHHARSVAANTSYLLPVPIIIITTLGLVLRLPPSTLTETS